MYFVKYVLGFLSVFVFTFIVLLFFYLFDSKTLNVSETTANDFEAYKIVITDVNTKVDDLKQVSDSFTDLSALAKAKQSLQQKAGEIKENANYIKSPEVKELFLDTSEVALQEAGFYDVKAEDYIAASTVKTIARKKLQTKMDRVYVAIEAQKNSNFIKRFTSWFEIRFRMLADSFYERVVS